MLQLGSDENMCCDTGILGVLELGQIFRGAFNFLEYKLNHQCVVKENKCQVIYSEILYFKGPRKCTF